MKQKPRHGGTAYIGKLLPKLSRGDEQRALETALGISHSHWTSFSAMARPQYAE